MKQFSHCFRIAHGLLAISLLGGWVTGFTVYAMARPSWSLFSGTLPVWLMNGRMHMYHLLVACLFTPAVCMLIWSSRRGLAASWRHKKPLHMAKLLLTVVCGMVLLSGCIILFPQMPGQWYGRAVHLIASCVFVPLVLGVHLFYVWKYFRSQIWETFRPWKNMSWMTIGLFIPLFVVSSVLFFNVGMPNRTLVSTQIVTPDDWKRQEWNAAEPLQTSLSNGVGFDDGVTQVTLQSYYDDRYMYLRVQWDDPQEDRRYFPWLKTDDGWQHLVTHPKDETVYYEDKFSLIFPVEEQPSFRRAGCALYCHASSEHAYGYKASNHLVDVWHWKASRTDGFGIVDDKYWFGHDLEAKNIGRFADPKTSGYFRKNITADGMAPAWLPAQSGAAAGGVLVQAQSIPATANQCAAVPVGSTVPGIVVSPVTGDRADVQCHSEWADGMWTLIIRRALQTASDGKDVQFQSGQQYDFAVAAFDHASKRHAYNHHVFQLILAE